MVIAFNCEEGVRFQTTFLDIGNNDVVLDSGGIAGILPATTLEISDERDVLIKDFLKENSIDITEESLLKLKYDPKSVWGYIEVHIKQGPVLEQVGSVRDYYTFWFFTTFNCKLVRVVITLLYPLILISYFLY